MKSLKTTAMEWITEQCQLNSINNPESALLDVTFYFQIKGFADEPNVFIKATDNGLIFGFETVQWDGPIPASTPAIHIKHTLSWSDLVSLDLKGQQMLMLDVLMKTINSRKRQYRTCKFCSEKVAIEHRYDQNTCHGCASEQYGVLY